MKKKKVFKKIANAIKQGNYAKMVKLCKKYNFGVEAEEELILRAMYKEYKN